MMMIIIIIMIMMIMIIIIMIIIIMIMIIILSKPPSLLHSLLATFQQFLKAANPLLQQLLRQP